MAYLIPRKPEDEDSHPLARTNVLMLSDEEIAALVRVLSNEADDERLRNVFDALVHGGLTWNCPAPGEPVVEREVAQPSTYHSEHVWVGTVLRYAVAYENAHKPGSGEWFVRVHEQGGPHGNSSHNERWFGGRVLTGTGTQKFLTLSRNAAIATADGWAIHGTLPAIASVA